MPDQRHNTNELEQRLDALGRASRDAPAPKEPPSAFLDAVRSAQPEPVVQQHRWVIGAVVGAAACLALVGLINLPTLDHPGAVPHTDPGISSDDPQPRLHSSSVLSLRLRNEGRPLDDLDLPDASIVHWVSGASPF